MSDQPTQQFPELPEPPDGQTPTDQRRRRWRDALIAVLATLAMLLPVGIYLALRSGDQSTGSGGAAPTAPTASAPATASPSGKPSSTASPARNGRISLETLGNSTLTIPPWPTDNVRGPSGSLRFRNGTYPIPQSPPQNTNQPPIGTELVILAVTYGDLDRDGADETMAEIGCFIEGGSQQLVAFDRTASSRIVTMGTVVSTTGEIREIRTGSARVGDDGVVTARLADYRICCGDETPQTWQDRGYRWYGGQFHQVSGPTRMSANPAVTETSVSTGELVLGPAVSGYRYGTLTVTARHRWGTHPRQLAIQFYPSAGLERTGTAWPPVSTAQGRAGFMVAVAAPPVRGAATYTFAFRRSATVAGGTLEIEAGGASATGSPLSEANPWNNGATATIRTVD